MSHIERMMCGHCPLTLANKDPAWRFSGRDGHCIRQATLADEDVIGAYILTMPPNARRRRYHGGISALAAYQQRTETHEKFPPDGVEHIEFVAVAPCGAILGACHANADHECHSIGISVAEALEGRGLASRLLRATMDWAQEADNVRALLAITECENGSMIALAKRHGFRPLTAAEKKSHVVDPTESPWWLQF